MPAFQPPPAFQGDAFQTSAVPLVLLTDVLATIIVTLLPPVGAGERPSEDG